MDTKDIKEEKKKKGKIERLAYNTYNNLLKSISDSIKSIFSLATTILKLVLLVTKPVQFIIAIVQLIKSRVFATVLLVGSVFIVGYASIESTELVLRELYPKWSDEQISTFALRTIMFLEVVMVVFKITKRTILASVSTFLVLLFTVGSIGYDIVLNYDNMALVKLILYAVVTLTPTILSTMLMFSSASEVSKISKNPKLDKAFKRSKSNRFSLSKEEREKLNIQILEHVDYNGDSIESFNSIQEIFQDRVKGKGYVQRLLKKERPLLFEKIKSKQKKGRKEKV